MALTYQVLRCLKCSVFQVHPTKKARTWACKMCDQKQSLKRFYSLGTAKECRLHVQTLNEVRGEIEEKKCTHSLSDISYSQIIPELEMEDSSNTPKKSKWEDFLDANNLKNLLSPDENTSLNTEVGSEQPKKRLKKTPKNKCITKIPNKKNRSSPAKSENSLIKGNPIDCDQHVTVIYNAKPKVSGTKQRKLVKPDFPPADTDLSWMKFVADYNLNDPFVNNDDHSQSEPSEWFSAIDDKDLDAILEF